VGLIEKEWRSPANMRTTTWMVLLTFTAVSLTSGALRAQEAEAPVVEAIEVANNQFLSRETLLYYVTTKAGDPYDEPRLKDDFRRLWDTGFLDDLVLESVDGKQGKVVRFRVVERKRIQIVDFRGSKELSTRQIEEELEKKELKIKLDTFYDTLKARKVESVIRGMLEAKGHPFATVRHENKNVGGAGTQLSFAITDGPRARVKEVVFDGNELFSDSKLRGRMKKLKPRGLWNLAWIGSKSTYTPEKWNGDEEDPRGDHGRVEDFYLSLGYVQSRVGQPKLSYFDGKSGLFRKKPVKWIRLEIPITEGDQYRVGEIKLEGVKVMKEPFVRSFFKLQTGDIYDDGRLRKGYEKVRDVYGQLGYFQFTGATRRTPDALRKVVDLTLAMEEDKQYFVGKIEFKGNDSSRDKVIRRELFMNEGDVFSTEVLKASIRRVNQLGYFKPMEGAPDIKPSSTAEDRLDITFKVDEQNRNQFTFGGGVSGYEGAFLNASFQTSNFLGKGETFTLAAQTGSRTRNYQFSVSEPYFLDRPITAGFDVFFRRISYESYGTFVGFGQQSQGISLSTGISVGRFSRVFASYSYQIIDIYEIAAASNYKTTSSVVATTLDESYYGGFGRRHESSISPSWVRNTVDNPYQPRRGSRYTVGTQFVGGPFRGDVDYIRPHVELVQYLPVRKKMALGVRGEVGYIWPFGNTVEVPYYQRYFLGGETQIRGYNARTVAPYDPKTKSSIGGDKFLLVNAEYYFDVFGPLRALLFFDAGQAYEQGQGFYWKTMSTSVGAEVRFLMPVLNVPFRLIYALNPNRDFYQPDHAFKFAVGTTF
jgi:outer membrane protein insertion porin family